MITTHLKLSNSNKVKDSSQSGLLDADELGQWSESDFDCLTKFEWEEGEDKNALDPSLEYVSEIPTDEDGIELGWDPVFGPSNPIDERTIITPKESFVTDKETRDENFVQELKYFSDGDPELALNDEVSQIRKGMKIIDTHYDEYLDMEVPRNTAEWFGEVEKIGFPKKDFYNNRFTKEEDRTDFNSMTPYQARKKAVEMARQRNNEWLPEGTAQSYWKKKTDIFKKKRDTSRELAAWGD